MKKFVVAGICFLVSSLFSGAVLKAADKDDLSGTITISGAFALYPMAVKWSEEFQKIHPGVRIDISAGGAGKGMADALSGIADIGMVSREIHMEEVAKGAWHVALVKDAVVATVNEKNPALPDLLSKGLKREALVDIWVSGKSKTWGDLLGAKMKDRINAYTRSDACGAAEIWAKYLGKKQEDLLGVAVYGDPGIAQAVQRDSLAIGYNNINFAYDAKTRKQLAGIRVVPIDINGNGAIDADENFYATLDQIDTAISLGKYPSPPARELYFVSKGRPQKKLVIEFMKWALTDGQKFVPEAGYIRLSDERLLAELLKIQGK
jgi:phosphate transport system substrate-binding protein